MHPLASSRTCSGHVIDAHSIQRKGPLSTIVDGRNHVSQLTPSTKTNDIEVSKIGWKKASTFPGYCAAHDSAIFKTLEQQPFTGTHEQCVLLAFRNVCNELYKKRALLVALRFQRDVIDRGCNLDEQINRQLTISENILGQSKSEAELEKLWSQFQQALNDNDLNMFESRVFFFNGTLSVVSSSAMPTEYDFAGRQLKDLWNIHTDAEMLSHATINTKNGGAVVFTWLTHETTPRRVVDSYDSLLNEDKGDIFVQYCFLNCENTYFSLDWWQGLETPIQNQLKNYARALFYEGGPFVANSSKLVDWDFG